MLKAAMVSRAKATVLEAHDIEFSDAPLKLKIGGEWNATDSGVWRESAKQAGMDIIKKIEWASPIPILPTELMVNGESGLEKIRIEFYKNGRWQHIICDRSKVASAHDIVKLADLGMEVNSDNAKLLVKYIAECVSLNNQTIPISKSTDHLGWLDGAFVPYDKTIRFDGEKEYKYLFDAISERGDFEAWKKYTLKLRENEFLRMQMAASFASVLIQKINGLPFVLHLWGGTGAGKTVGMMCAMSIWGNPTLGKLTRTMNMTDNSMMSAAATLRNLPFAGDELQTIRDKDYDRLIMRVTEGVDRGRMNYNSMMPTRSWKCSFLFTGEEPCTKSHSGGGVINRVVEIECTHPVVDNGNEVVDFVTANYGHAGKVFVEAVSGMDLTEEYNSIFREILSLTDTTEKQAQALAIMVLADGIACDVIYDRAKALTASDVAKYATSKHEVDVANRAYEYIMSEVELNLNRFNDNENSGEIWGQVDDYVVTINRQKLIDVLRTGGFDFNAVKSKWAERGLLMLNSQGRFAFHTKCYNVKGRYVKLKRQSEGNDDEKDNGDLPF